MAPRTEQPRLSSLLVLLIAALSAYGVSFGAVWLPGANGRFGEYQNPHLPQERRLLTATDDELAPLKVKRTNLPKKPRRYFLPGLVFCILLRLEIFHRVTLDLQCSKAGIEVNCIPPVGRIPCWLAR